MTDKSTDKPFDFNKFRAEVEARLIKIRNPRFSAIFAARMALAALPMLSERADKKGFLWYWEQEDREKHLLAVCRALQIWIFLPTKFTRFRSEDAYADDARDATAIATAAARAANTARAADATAATATDAAADAAAVVVAYAHDAANAVHARTNAYATYAHTDAYVNAAVYDHADVYAARAAHVAHVVCANGRLIDWVLQELKQFSRRSNADDYLSTPFPDFLSPEPFLSQLRQLPSFDYWADWLRDRYDGIPINREILEKSVRLPEELEAQGPRAINRYLAELAGGGKQEKIRRVRAIFIGNGEAGKTSLIQALNGEQAVGDTEMTPGVEISEWKVPGTDLTAHFWDFGGQVIAHATHQFFLRERCVYVLVLNARSTDSNPNQQAEYWLEFVRAFGNDAPVLLVGNKCDLTPVQVDLNRLRESYPNIRGFHGLAATQYRGQYAREFGIFQDAFTAELSQAGEEARLYFSRAEFRLIEELRAKSRQAAFLEKSDFEAACERRGIVDREKRRDLLGLLDQLGEVIHFPALYRVHGFRELLLNPRWLTHGVYRLLYSDLLKEQHGVLKRGNVVELLKGRSVEDEHGNRLDYPEERLDFLIRAMAEFKLCYPAPDAPHDKWIVPDLLPSDQPEGLNFDQRGGLRFDFRFESFLKWIVPDLLPSDQPAGLDFHRPGFATNAPFNNRQQPGIHGDDHRRTLPDTAPLRFDFRFESFLPRHVLSMFIVEHYRDIENNLAWQHGVCLQSRRWRKTRALVRADYQSRVLRLAVTGQHVDAYFPVLYDSILTILERMPRLKHTQRLHLDDKARIGGEGAFPGQEVTADFEDLLAAKAKGLGEFTCKFGDYDLQRLLHLVPEGMKRVPARGPALGEEAERGIQSAPGAAFEGKASLWEKLGGLGGVATVIGLVVNAFKELPPFINSLGIGLIAVGGGMLLAALAVWLWRRSKGSGYRFG